MKTEHAIGLAAGVGVIYFYAEEAQVPSDANCSYLASPLTDAVATAGGLLCSYKGLQLDEPLVAAFGTAVVTIHLLQYWHHKRG